MATDHHSRQIHLLPDRDESRWPPETLRVFDVAGQYLATNHAFDLLTPFAVDVPPNLTFPQTKSIPQDPTQDEDAARHALGRIDGSWRDVAVVPMQDSYRIEIEGIGRFVSDIQSRQISWLDPDATVTPDQLVQAALGAPFVLQLAHQGVWLLHASSALLKGRLAAFMGKSGRGKSTLAAFLGAQPHWARVSDDMLPISRSPDGVEAWPRFPQYKLPADAQPGLDHPKHLPLNAIYIIEPPSPNVNTVEILSVPPMEAATTIIGQTAISKLFDHALLTPHFEFAIFAADVLRVRMLRYPRRFDALPALAAAIEADIGQL